MAQRRRLETFQARVRTCMHATTGAPTCIDLKEPLGDPESDQRIIDAVEEWRFTPIGVDFCLDVKLVWKIG